MRQIFCLGITLLVSSRDIFRRWPAHSKMLLKRRDGNDCFPLAAVLWDIILCYPSGVLEHISEQTAAQEGLSARLKRQIIAHRNGQLSAQRRCIFHLCDRKYMLLCQNKIQAILEKRFGSTVLIWMIFRDGWPTAVFQTIHPICGDRMSELYYFYQIRWYQNRRYIGIPIDLFTIWIFIRDMLYLLLNL